MGLVYPRIPRQSPCQSPIHCSRGLEVGSPQLEVSERHHVFKEAKTMREHLEDLSRLLQETFWADSRSSYVSPRLDNKGPRLVRIKFRFHLDFCSLRLRGSVALRFGQIF